MSLSKFYFGLSFLSVRIYIYKKKIKELVKQDQMRPIESLYQDTKQIKL